MKISILHTNTDFLIAVGGSFRDIGFENATEEDCDGFITKIDYESAYIKCIAKVRNEPTLCKDNVDMDFRSTEEMIFD